MSIAVSDIKGSGVSVPKKEKTPRFLSWAWFKWIGGACMVWKYSSREWAIYHLSSYCTHLMWVGGLGAFKFITSKLPLALIEAVKVAWLKVVAFTTALFHVVFGQ